MVGRNTREWGRHSERMARRMLPRSYFGRSILIVIIPLLVAQGVALGLFYGNYVPTVSRRLSDSVVGEMALALDRVDQHPEEAEMIFAQVKARTQIDMIVLPGAATLDLQSSENVLGPMDEALARAIRQVFDRPFRIDWNADRQSVRVQIGRDGNRVDVVVPRKRLDVGPIWLFVVWVVGSSLLLLLLAGLFVRNQVQAIRRLARAAEAFGVGRDLGPIEPQGAQEIRKAAVAFNRMQARVNRFVAQRTAVLAGVSHDLRTPLTRLRLTLAMLPMKGLIEAASLRPDVEDMVADIEEMERLIGSYLSFARGEGAETPILTDLRTLIDDVAQSVTRAGGIVMVLPEPGMCEATIRPDAVRRVLINVADNARRHGGRISFGLRTEGRQVVVIVDDDGPGIPEARRKQVFRAYDTEGPSGGNGLGLTIARDIVHAHGGTIRLGESPMGGLRVWMTLPK
ncbi:ATP-binding protein [Brytella acorum]|uniref:histidine kinase n=1 Tax=Brytella acorum TaxID=2959299 RepID=A0AA35UW90_9PROT|nr:ATP-binding protein [Brytella acorum]MDF3624148.1 ATP-binding protein [Brytella acorum]CAI9120654.1 ATP-binding protein [Brytella acorum]